MLYYGGALVSNHDLTVGALTSFIFYAGYAAISMTGLTKFYTELNKGVGAAARIWEIFDRQTSIPVEGGIVPSALPKGNATYFLRNKKYENYKFYCFFAQVTLFSRI